MKPAIHPWNVMGRLLTCTKCGSLVDLVEPQGQHVKPADYVCLACHTPKATQAAETPAKPWVELRDLLAGGTRENAA